MAKSEMETQTAAVIPNAIITLSVLYMLQTDDKHSQSSHTDTDRHYKFYRYYDTK